MLPGRERFVICATFTFQYGSIQMDTMINIRRKKDEFTFQYGSIQIKNGGRTWRN